MRPKGAPPPPPRFMRRVRWDRAPYASLDFEATGLDFGRDTIISFGVVPVDGARVRVGAATYELVDPGDVAPSRDSIIVHGLRPMDLTGAPSLDAARESLRACLERRFLLVWFAGVEAAFLDKLFGGGTRSWMRRSVDVVRLVIALEAEGGHLPAELGYSLESVAGRYGVPVASPHHALDDALVTAQLFLVVASRLAARDGPWNVRRMLAATVEDLSLLRARSPI